MLLLDVSSSIHNSKINYRPTVKYSSKIESGSSIGRSLRTSFRYVRSAAHINDQATRTMTRFGEFIFK